MCDTHGMRFEWPEDRAPSTAVVAAVAAVEDVPPTELPPLQYSVAVDGLDALIEHRTEDADVDVCVSFEYAGYTVTVDQEEGIHLDPATPDAIETVRGSDTSYSAASFDSIDGFERCDPIDDDSSAATEDENSSTTAQDGRSSADATDERSSTGGDEESSSTDADEGSGASGSSASE